jgi:hypothetical protein
VISLLEQLQGLIERTYNLSTGIDDIGAFVIGDEGLRVLYAGTPLVDRIDHGAPSNAPDHRPTARTLVRQDGDDLRLTLYYPDTLIEHLEEHPPLRSLDEHNVDAFAVFVEELDHLLHIAHRRRSGRELTLLELEWQANITKSEVVRHLLARRLAPAPLGEAEERWVRFHLFEKFAFSGDDPEVVERYREAARLAVRTLGALDPLDPRARLAELRAFARRSFPEKIRSAGARS